MFKKLVGRVFLKDIPIIIQCLYQPMMCPLNFKTPFLCFALHRLIYDCRILSLHIFLVTLNMDKKLLIL